MSQILSTDICVIGAGSAGLSVAAGASQMGARVVLVERGRMGGDCLNSGCVPSKALLAAAHAVQAVRDGRRFGVVTGEASLDLAEAHAHVQRTIAAIAPHDSQERFEGLGVRVIKGAGLFTTPSQLVGGDWVINARRFVIATGSRPAIPPIPGIERVPHFTNETLFDHPHPIPHLVIIGGGPIAVEMAQAHRRLGSRVTLLVRSTLLKRDDPELVAVVRERLAREGVNCRVGLEFLKVEGCAAGVAVELEQGGERHRVEGSHLLVATGRRPNVERLQLEVAGVGLDPNGFIATDRRLRTTNRRIHALGDVVGHHLFTHAAAYQAGIVVRNLLFRLPAKVDYRGMAWVTYSDPELAQVGMTEARARAEGGKVTVLTKPFAENDRARAEGATEGLIKVMVGRGGRILGASIVGRRAGELIQIWSLAMARGLGIGAMASYIAPYPTLGEISKGVAGSYFTPTLYGERTRRLVRLLARWG